MNIKNTFLTLLASIFLVSCSTQGPKGEQGLQGEAGNGIVSIIKTNNEGLIDTYTITYTDGTTSTFTVTNGQNGNQGIQGEPGKDGHTPVITIGDNGNWFIDGVDSGFKAFNEVKTFVVTFHLNGGVLPEGYSETLIVNQGDTLDLPIPLKDGYVFTGWYTGETVNDKQFSNSDGVFKDLDLFATYEIAKDVIVKNGVTYLLDYDTFEATIKRYDGFNFTDGDIVTIPEQIPYGNNVFRPVRILENAFSYDYCTLKEITLPDSIKVIDTNAFHIQDKMTYIRLSENLESIGDCAFDRCISLESIFIPSKTSEISITAFSGCENLKEIIVSEENIFYDSRDNCNAIIESQNNKLFIGIDSSTIPDTVSIIGARAFSGLNNIPNIPKSVSVIEDEAFVGNSGFIDKLDLSSVSSIGADAFRACVNIGEIIFSDKLESISEGCFSACNAIENITLPNSILKIESRAFSYCNSLNSIKWSENLEVIGSHAFSNCTSLKNITLPDSVLRIEEESFSNCNSLNGIKLSKKLEVIGVGAFASCTSLTEIYIEKNLKQIEPYAFYNTISMKEIYYSGTQEERNNINIDKSNNFDNITFHFSYEF